MSHRMESGDGSNSPQVLSALTLRQELAENAIALGVVGPHATNDNAYVIPDYKWLRDTFLPYYLHLKTGMGLHHAVEGFDCDNFAAFLKLELAFANRRSKYVGKGDVPCAFMKVRQGEAFGAVHALGGDFHSLNLIRTSEGWFVIEPQDGTMARLSAYPNRNSIVDLYF